MYAVRVNLENRTENIKFYSSWAARIMSEKWAKCYDVESVVVINDETGEIGYEFEKGVMTYAAHGEF